MKTFSTTIKLLAVTVAFFAIPITLQAQYNIIQKGQDIDGEAAGDRSGESVSMPDQYTVAIAAPNNRSGSYIPRGHVRIYKWNGTTWMQKGSDIDVDTLSISNSSISMPDSNTIAIGLIPWYGYYGHVRIFKWNGVSWIQRGTNIMDTTRCGNFLSVDMPDSNTVAIGTNFGFVKVFSWSDSAWVQKGAGLVSNSIDGNPVSMPDENTIAFGSPNFGVGNVRVFTWNGTSWTQKGLAIDGEFAGDFFGRSVSMPDINTVAAGAPRYDIDTTWQGSDEGQVRIFTWDGQSWNQKGLGITGANTLSEVGSTLSMPNAKTIAIGSSQRNVAKIYSWESSSWLQKGPTITGEAIGDGFGWSVTMPDTNTLGIGAPFNGNGLGSGHVRVFTIQSNIGVSERHIGSFRVFPNPARETITITHPNAQFNQNTNVILYDVLGNELLSQVPGRVGNVYELDVSRFSAGVYILKVFQNNDTLVTERVVINR